MRRARKHQAPDKFYANDERSSWTPFRNRVMEFGVAMCAVFASFYSAYALQKYKTLVNQNSQSAAVCFSAQNKVGYFDSFLKGFGMDTFENFNRMLGVDTSILQAFVKEYANGFKPYYVLDHLPQDQIELFLKPIPFTTMSWLESNEKSALKSTFNERLPSTIRIRTLFAAYQFDSLRQYMLYSEQQYFQGLIKSDTFASRLRAVNILNERVIRVLNPPFHSVVKFRFPNY